MFDIEEREKITQLFEKYKDKNWKIKLPIKSTIAPPILEDIWA